MKQTDNSTSKKKAKKAKEPQYKQWRIASLSDIAQVEPWHLDKVIYFLNHSIRKCHIQNLRLVAMTYHEKGAIQLETEELEPKEDKAEASDVDPLA